ncbi:MAG: hypothetical protein IKU17_08340 [Clostridia bacterium]|nr:hypothetical protein [Clostridia bacterium]
MLTVVSVICTGLAFAALLEHKYNRWITLAAMGGTAVVAMLMAPVFGLLFMPSSGLSSDVLANAAVNFVFFIASLFVFHNHVLQKLAVTLLSAFHLAFFPALGAWMMGVAGSPVMGIGAVMFCCVLYLFGSLLAWLLVNSYFRYFKEQHFSLSGLWVLGCVLVLLYANAGGFDAALRITQYWPRYALCFVLYGVFLFSLVALVGAGQFAQRRAELVTREEHLQAKSEYCRSMLVNVEALKEMNGGRNVAGDGYLSALFASYSTNPYVNAVIATYAADAELNGVRFEFSNSGLSTGLKTMEICTLLTDTLTAALTSAENCGMQDPFIRLSISSTANRLVIETVYSSDNEEKLAPFSKENLLGMLDRFFHGKDLSPKESFVDTQYLVDTYSGRFGIAHGKKDSIIRIAINK